MILLICILNVIAIAGWFEKIKFTLVKRLYALFQFMRDVLCKAFANPIPPVSNSTVLRLAVYTCALANLLYRHTVHLSIAMNVGLKETSVRVPSIA